MILDENSPLDMKNILSISESLQERTSGICLEPNHAKMIWQGNKDIIIREKSYRFATNKPFYLIGGNECYGVVVLTKSSQITLNDFETLKNRHRITDDERKGWWPNKQVLYRYDFVLVEKFETPRLVKVSDGSQTFLYDISFIGDPDNLEEIDDMKKYNPSKLRTDQLKNNFRIALAWHTSKTKGVDIPYSFGGIEKVLKLTFDELTNRGIVFHPEKMDTLVKKIFDKISEQPKSSTNLKDDLSELVSKYKPVNKTTEYNDINKLIPVLYGEDQEQKYEIEKNYNGARVIIAKKGPVARIYSAYSLLDMTTEFMNLVPQILGLSSSDIVLDCRLSSDTENNKIYVADILFRDTDLSDLSWDKRYNILKHLNFQEDIKEVAGIVVNNKDEARKAIKLFCWMSSTEGAIIKKFDSLYNDCADNNSSILFKLNK